MSNSKGSRKNSPVLATFNDVRKVTPPPSPRAQITPMTPMLTLRPPPSEGKGHLEENARQDYKVPDFFTETQDHKSPENSLSRILLAARELEDEWSRSEVEITEYEKMTKQSGKEVSQLERRRRESEAEKTLGQLNNRLVTQLGLGTNGIKVDNLEEVEAGNNGLTEWDLSPSALLRAERNHIIRRASDRTDEIHPRDIMEVTKGRKNADDGLNFDGMVTVGAGKEEQGSGSVGIEHDGQRTPVLIKAGLKDSLEGSRFFKGDSKKESYKKQLGSGKTDDQVDVWKRPRRKSSAAKK